MHIQPPTIETSDRILNARLWDWYDISESTGMKTRGPKCICMFPHGYRMVGVKSRCRTEHAVHTAKVGFRINLGRWPTWVVRH